MENKGKEKMQDYEDRLITYFDHFKVSESVITMFDIQEYLSIFEDLLQNKLYMCKRKRVCKCGTECFCDDDEFFDISKIKGEVCSNCKYILDIVFKKIKTRKPKKELFRFFMTGETKGETNPSKEHKEEKVSSINNSFETETPVFDLGLEHITLYGSQTYKFNVEDISCRENVLTISFDYMSFH